MTARLDTRSSLLALGFVGAAAFTGLLAGIDPRFAIAATLAIAFVLVAIGNLVAGLSAFTIIAFLEFALPTGVVSLTKAAGILLALAWLARVATADGRERIFFRDHPGATYLMLAFLGWGAASISWSEAPSSTLVDLSRFLLNFFLLAITYTALRRSSDVVVIIGTWIVGTAISAAYGLVIGPADPNDLRLESSVGNSNVLATILVAGTVLAVAIAIIAKRSPLIRLGACGTAALALFSLILTGSRSGVLALVAVLIAGVLVAGPRRRMQALAGAVVISAAAAVFFVAFAPPEIKARLGETVPGQVPATEGRTTIWQVGWRMVEDNPVKGVGLGSFQTSSIHYVIEPGMLDRTDQIIDTPKVAHNIYLQALAELGVIGLLMILGILIFPVVCALRAAKRFARVGNGQMVIISKAVVVALVGIFTADFFASEISSKLLWLLLALGPTLLAISSDEARAREPGLGRQRRPAVARA